MHCLGFYPKIKGIVESPSIIVTRILSHLESSAVVHIGHVYNTSDYQMSDKADSSIPMHSFSIIEQATKQDYLNFQAELPPAR